MIKNILAITIVLLTASIVSAQPTKTFGEGADMYMTFALCSTTTSLLNEYSAPITMIDEGYGVACNKKNKKTFNCTFKSYEDASTTDITFNVASKNVDSIYLNDKAKVYTVVINKETLVTGLIVNLVEKDLVGTKNCSGTVANTGGK